MQAVITIIAAPLFIIALVAHIYVKLFLRPGKDFDLDDYYHEFEDRHPQLEKYEKFSHLTFAAVCVAALLLFIALIL